MTRTSSKALRWAVLGLVATVATAAAAETYSIGTLGATIPADSWERGTLSSDFGPDQFLRVDRNLFMVFFQSFGLYQERADFLEGLDGFIKGAATRMPDLDLDPEVGYVRTASFTRATRWFSGTAAGVALGYELDMISAGDGLGYVVMGWSPLANFDDLKEHLERTLSGMELPGPDSEWGRKTTPSAHEYTFDDWTVEVTFRDSVFSEANSQPGQRYTLSEIAGGITVHLFLDELEGDADEVLDEVRKVAAGSGTYEELSRSDLDLATGPGRQLLMRSDSVPPSDLAIAVIGLGDDRWVDLRMVSTDRAGHREALWDGLVRSVRVTLPEEVDAFPVVADSEETEPSYVAPSARRLLEASRSLGDPGSEVVAMLGDDTFLVDAGSSLELHSASGTEGPSIDVLYESEAYITGKFVASGDRIFLVDTNGEVSQVADGDLRPASFGADAAAPAGDGLVIVRNGRRDAVLGLADLPPSGPAEILLRGADGEERALAELPAQDVAALAYRSTGEVLAATRPRVDLDPPADSRARRLVLVRGGQDAREIARWERVDRIEPAPGGWLVTGSPSAGSQGIHRLDDDGHAELLVSGDPVGLALSDDGLTFQTASCLEPSDEYLRNCVYRADLDLVRELGAAFQPFTAQVLNEVAAQALPDLAGASVDGFPPTREAISEVVAAADEAAGARVGTTLPHSPAGVDALLSQLSYDRDLSEPGIALLTVLLSDSLLREGAQWEPSSEPHPRGQDRLGWEARTAFAVGLHPLTVVRSTLYDEEGWYQPAEGIGREAGGRAIVLGLDPDRVRARVRAAELPELEDLLRAGRAPQITAVLERQPENVHLREVVYKHLAAYGQDAALATLAETFARRDDAQGVDLVTWMAARLHGNLSANEVSAAVADLREAIAREPDQAALYLLLGTAYERTDRDDRLALARASYRKAQETVGWGPLHSAAEQALERLADGE